mgnify:CR=1 FL=1
MNQNLAARIVALLANSAKLSPLDFALSATRLRSTGSRLKAISPAALSPLSLTLRGTPRDKPCSVGWDTGSLGKPRSGEPLASPSRTSLTQADNDLPVALHLYSAILAGLARTMNRIDLDSPPCSFGLGMLWENGVPLLADEY